MDMRSHLRLWLNDAELERRESGAYEGVIADVVEQVVRNPFTTKRETHPVLVFDDGWRWIPNFGSRTQLVRLYGAETDAWRGKRVRIFRRRENRVDKTTGEVKTQFAKTVMQCDARPSLVGHTEPVREFSDYDDSPEALAAARGRRR
jgi:hypothetical protein